MKHTVLILVMITLLTACSNKETEHLPAPKMQSILFDIHLAEVYSIVIMQDSNNRNTERNQDSLAAYYKTVLNHHKVTPQQFEQSLDWYQDHPEQLDSIYNRMIPEMSKLEGKYSNLSATVPVQ